MLAMQRGLLAFSVAWSLAACGGSSADDSADDTADDSADDAGDDSADDAGDDDSGTPDAPGGIGEPAELEGITLFHNQVRAAVDTRPGIPPLVWSDALEATAAAWAAQCVDETAPIGLIDHNPDRSDGHPYYVGENIYGSGGTGTAADAVQLWAAEVEDYSYPANTCSGVCGHYTQIVWRDSMELGCAKFDCPGLQYGSSIVCNYGPGGNIGGELPY
jgi:pathogenesis-related protein 1